MSATATFDTKKKVGKSADPVLSIKPKGESLLSQNVEEMPSPTVGPISASFLGHDFSHIRVYAISSDKKNIMESCPLESSPTRCPYAEACNICPPRLQTKLAISEPGDEYEREADRVADIVMRMPKPNEEQEKKCGLPSCLDIVQRCAEGSRASCEGEPVPTIVHEVLRSPGQPLDSETRAFFEPRFCHDFSQARVHTDTKAAESARAENAFAYTAGRDVVFGDGQFSPTTTAGRILLAHELAHVVQQNKLSETAPHSVLHIQRNNRREKKEPPPVKPEKKEPNGKNEEWVWWGPDCGPAPKGVSNEKLLDRVNDIIKVGRTLGFKLAADNLENYLFGKKSRVNLPTELLAKNTLVVSHLGPDSNPTPSEAVIRSTMGDKKGIENLLGEHHVVFLGGALKRLESGTVKFGQQFDMHYKDSISFYSQGGGQYPDLAYGIGGCTVYSDATVEAAREDSEVLLHYISWRTWIDDIYNFDKGKVALFPMGFCIPDSDLVRLKEAGYAKDFYMSTGMWSNSSKWLALWFPLPYRPLDKKG